MDEFKSFNFACLTDTGLKLLAGYFLDEESKTPIRIADLFREAVNTKNSGLLEKAFNRMLFS
jgi:hypothetical protein